jgi:hypothetical protein
LALISFLPQKCVGLKIFTASKVCWPEYFMRAGFNIFGLVTCPGLVRSG